MPNDPFAPLRELIASEPKHPFQTPAPRGYRQTPLYRQWQADHKAWLEQVRQRRYDGLDIIARDDYAAATIHGRVIPDLAFQRLSDGVITICPAAGEDNLPAWFIPLEIPGPKQKLDAWASKNRNRNNRTIAWPIQRRVNEFLKNRGIAMPTPIAAEPAPQLDQLHANLAEALRRMLDYTHLTRLRRVTGPHQHTVTLAEYNIAVGCGELLAELARSNPGAVGWWLGVMHLDHILRYYRPPEKRELIPPPPAELPRHPGEIIAQAKHRFRQSGGVRWKTLVKQPAADMFGLAISHASESVAALVNAVEPGRPDLPYRIKTELAAMHRYAEAMNAVRQAAFERTIILACREFAGQPEAEPDIQEVVDYAVAEPETALRRASWTTLQRAAQQWHLELGLRAPRMENPDLEWTGAIAEYRNPQFHARLLASSRELAAETALMRHCVGEIYYDRLCAAGKAVIFHIEPADPPPGNEQERRKQATTVLLSPAGPEWRATQHRGYRNRRPTRTESQRGQQLARAYTQAAARQRAAPEV